MPATTCDGTKTTSPSELPTRSNRIDPPATNTAITSSTPARIFHMCALPSQELPEPAQGSPSHDEDGNRTSRNGCLVCRTAVSTDGDCLAACGASHSHLPPGYQTPGGEEPIPCNGCRP